MSLEFRIDNMAKTKGIIASIDALVGVLAFSVVAMLFFLNTVIAKSVSYNYVSSQASFVATNARLQHSIFLIERLGMNMSDAKVQLNSDIGSGNYSIVPFSSNYNPNMDIERLLIVDSDIYYVYVNFDDK